MGSESPAAKSIAPAAFTVALDEGGVHLIDRLAEEWRELCSRAVDDQPFYRPEWIRAYLRAFVPDAVLLLLSVRLDGRLHLVLPLVRERVWLAGIPLRGLRAPANIHPGRFDAVRSAGAEGDAALTAACTTLSQSRWDILEFAHIPEKSTVAELISTLSTLGWRTYSVREKSNPYVIIPSNPDLRSRMPINSRLRTKLRQARRELTSQGSLKFSRVEVAEHAALERFYQLEASGWKGRQGSAIVSVPQVRYFYQEIAEAAASLRYFVLYMLELNERLLAAHFSLMLAGRCYSPKVAYDESFARYAPGHLIVAEILDDCASRGISVYDITGPADEWKMKWTTETYKLNRHVVMGRGALARLASAIRFKLRPEIVGLLRSMRKREKPRP
ncbi:MAG: GNAT family N-acetyltransferase [Acidobacteria bacterium]|nr:GNAT family N-acetyltransferase [Acidobacteriota bacterium]MBV8892945.1 GNAT family N-acetyltransferase [Acidobacteriota bacterium]